MTFQAAVLTMETSPVSELLEDSGNCRRILNRELNLHLLSDSLFSEQQKLKHVLDWAHTFISSGSDVHYELCRADSLILADEERREMQKITPPYKHSFAVSCTAGGKEMFGPFIDDPRIPFPFTPGRQEYRKTPENMKSMALQDPNNIQTPSQENNCRTSDLFISNQRQHTNLSNRATNQTDGATCSIKASTSCWSDLESKLSYKTAPAQSERDMSGRQMELSKVKVEGKVKTKKETAKEETEDARMGKRKGTMNEDSSSASAVHANNNMNSNEMEKTSNLSFSCHLKRPPTLTIYEQYQLCMDRLRVKQGQHIEPGCFIESPAEERKTSEETAPQNPAIKKHLTKAGSKRVTAAEITKKRSSGVISKKRDRSQCGRSRATPTEHRQIKQHDNLTVKETPAAICAERNTVSSNTHLVLHNNKCGELIKRTAGGITSADNVINTPMEHLGTTPGAALTSNPGLFPERIGRNPGVKSCQSGVKGQKTKAGGQGALLSLCEKSSVSLSSPTNKEILQRPQSSGVNKHTKRHTPEEKAKPSSACRHTHTPFHDGQGPTSSISSLFPERNNTDGNGFQSGVKGQTTKAGGEGASSRLCEKSSVSLTSPPNKEIQRRHQSSGVNKHAKTLTAEDKVKPSSACKHTHKCVPPSETHTPLHDDPGPTSSASGAYGCKQADKHSPAGVPVCDRWLCLPDEVWLSILSLLPLSDLCRVLQVCSRLHTLAADHTLWRNVRIENCNLTEWWLLCVGRRRPRSLCLYSCTDLSLTSCGLEMFFSLCRDFLEELKVTSCTGPGLHGDQMLPLIGQLCHHATSVDVSWSRATDKGVKALSDCCPGLRLKSVALNGCHVTDDPLMKLVMKHKERLEVFGCQFLTPSCLQTVYEMCPGLQHLNIGQVPKVNTHSLTVMTSQLKCLISLNLTGLQAVSDATVDTLLQNCVELQSLTVASCPGVTDLTLHSIRKYTPCLRSLDVRGCKAVTDAGVRSLALGCRRLQQLDLSSTGTGNRGVTLLANYCSGHLHTVKLSFCHITSENILKLCRHCKRLKVLHLYGCAHLPTERQIREVNATVKVYPLSLT